MASCKNLPEIVEVLTALFFLGGQAQANELITCTAERTYLISEAETEVTIDPVFDSELRGQKILFDTRTGDLTVCFRTSGCSVAWHEMQVINQPSDGNSFLAMTLKPGSARNVFATLKIAFWVEGNPFTYIDDGSLLVKGHCSSWR